MIIVTGGAGFIGSALIYELNKIGRTDIIVIDDLGRDQKWKNLKGLKFQDVVGIEDFLFSDFFEEEPADPGDPDRIDVIFHMGACSSTTETDVDFLLKNNVDYSKKLFMQATLGNIPFIYASSAATYGDGELGYDDNEDTLRNLRPLNPYGYSKQLFDEWVLSAPACPEKFAGLKFFNVFGPNEYHKGSMTSVVYKAFEQINKSGQVKLFKSHRDDFEDGEQQRDFVYVKDVARAMIKIWETKNEVQGIFNLGTGEERSFKDLVLATFAAMDKKENIQFIDMPENIRNQYQYYTKANMGKFKNLFSDFKFMSLEEAVKDYVQNHLSKKVPFLDLENE